MPRLLRSVPVSPLGAPARHPPIRDASSGPSSRRSAPGSASAPRASRADERRTPARGRLVASRSRGAHPRADGERCPEARGARAAPAVPGPPRHRRSKPAANRSRRRPGSLPESIRYPGFTPPDSACRSRRSPGQVNARSEGSCFRSTTDKHANTRLSGRRRRANSGVLCLRWRPHGHWPLWPPKPASEVSTLIQAGDPRKKCRHTRHLSTALGRVPRTSASTDASLSNTYGNT